MQSDRARWNQKYASSSKSAGRANPRLIETVGSMTPGWACDLAMGVGHNLRYLCEIGWKVLGIEISDLALIHAQRLVDEYAESAFMVQADVTRTALRPGAFDLVLCTYFLDRSIFPWIRTLLKPGGKLFFETYDTNHLKYAPDFPKEYCLRDGEPPKLLPGFRILQRAVDSGTSSAQSIVATRVT